MSAGDVLRIKISKYHFVDLVRIADRRKYLVVFGEKLGFQTRVFAEISFEDAMRAARFMASIDNQLLDDGNGDVTPPSVPMPKLDPSEIDD